MPLLVSLSYANMERHVVDATDPRLPNREVVSFQLPPINLFPPTRPENLSWEEKAK